MLPKNWPDYLFEGNAVSWIKNEALDWCKGKGVDVGGGDWRLPGAIPIDLQTEFQVEDFDADSLDYIFSSHTLEHIECWRCDLKVWREKLKIGGILFLYLPHEEGPWRNCKKHKWIPQPEPVIDALRHSGMTIIKHTTRPDNYCSFYIIAKKVLHNGCIDS